MRPLVFLFLLGLSLSQCKPKESFRFSSFPGKPGLPASIRQEHDSLLQQLAGFTKYGDSTARAALKLEELVKHHFQEEEDYVLPALGLLPSLADGQLPAESEQVIQMIRRFRENAAHMIAEHQFIGALLQELRHAAEKENHPGVKEFEKQIHHHARVEEEIYFPAALLVGDYLRLKTSP